MISRKQERKHHTKRPRLEFGGTVLVDLGFDDMMNEKVSSIMYGHFLACLVCIAR